MAACEHLEGASSPPPPDVLECGDCVAAGTTWVSLRQCLSCGNIGCCDSSPRRHASAHYDATGHPAARSVEPGEFWRVCFIHRVIG